MARRYLIALGSNVRHARHGRPAQVLVAALGELERRGIKVERASPVIASAPLGPSLRRYANGAAVVRSKLKPPALLTLLKSVERHFGRRSLWSGGPWSSPGLTVPHVAFRERDFVLRPALAVAPGWRDPLTGLSLRHLHARLTRPRPVPR